MAMKLLLISALVAVILADWRCAGTASAKFKNEAGECFRDYCLYMEPSTFEYAGLTKQRDKPGTYDTFLRSNIDNEQDKRDFNKESGLDHLPFRSFESAADDSHDSVKFKIEYSPAKPAIVVTTGIPYLVPFTWNNPHSSELEVNIWIMRNGDPVVVPIRKPACSGEGYRHVMLDFTIPVDFSELGRKIEGFTGCKNVGDCVLQIYAHSVETRTYAIGVPLFVKNQKNESDVTEGTTNNILPAETDRGVRYTSLRPLCLGSNSPETDIKSCVPRSPRLVSDVWNHAYQNSDYSPYSGQQPESISQNLQAACVLQMASANRGELGREYLKKENKDAYKEGINLRSKVKALIQEYEKVTKGIISNVMIPSKTKWIVDDTMDCPGNKWGTNIKTKAFLNTAKCFRCAEVGSWRTTRETKNTYIPSFEIPKELVAKATIELSKSPKHAKLMTIRGDGVGVVQIYNAVVQDMNEDLLSASKKHKLHYQGAMIKTEKMATKADPMNYKMNDANGKKDKGYYAASLVESEHKDHQIPVIADMFKQVLQVPKTSSQVEASSDQENEAASIFEDDDEANSALGMTISWLSAFSLFVGVVFQF